MTFDRFKQPLLVVNGVVPVAATLSGFPAGELPGSERSTIEVTGLTPSPRYLDLFDAPHPVNDINRILHVWGFS